MLLSTLEKFEMYLAATLKNRIQISQNFHSSMIVIIPRNLTN